MKKLCTLIVMMTFIVITAMGQGFNPQAKLESDKEVRTGKLENGLTYYIRHNAKPAQRAEFYILTKVGAIQETPAQDGLAHFLEHMCLNGTKNFPGKGIISYMERIGAKFGENINAGTGVEQTSYMLNNIPVIREGIIDTSLLVLHDYAAFVTNDPKEIDNERGVIIEEWRTRRDYSQRMREEFLKAYFKGSKYATCNIIGTKENLETFKPEELVNFYKTWYRPDMQAIIVVGDIDVDKIEAKIKKIFADIPKAVNPKAKDVITIPDNKEPIVAIFKDKECPYTNIDIVYKSEPMPSQYNPLAISVMNDIVKSLIGSILNERLDDIAKQPNAPFIDAGAGIYKFCATMEGFNGSVSAREGEGLKAFTALMTELERSKRYGFTQAEYDRAKANILRNYEREAANAAGRYNSQFVNSYINNFTDNEAYTTPEYMYDQVKGCLEMLNLDIINKAFASVMTDENQVITYCSPEKLGLAVPTAEQLIAVVNAIKAAKIDAPAGEVVNEPLMDASKLKGSAVKKVEKGKFETTILTLSNGIEVYVKSTNFKKDEVMLNLTSKGGSSLLPDSVIPSISGSGLGLYLQNAGISKFPLAKLKKILTGKAVSIAPFIKNSTQGIAGSSSPKDLETAFQLIYLYYTAPRFDSTEYNVTLKNMKNMLPNMEKQPNFIFSNAYQKAMFDNNPRIPLFNSELITKMNISAVEQGYRKLLSDAGASKLFISGNVNIDSLKPLLEKYIGSLPVKNKKGMKSINDKTTFTKRPINNIFSVEMKTPKTSLFIAHTGAMEMNLENDILFDSFHSILRMLYTKTIREDEGGTYGVSTEGIIVREPEQQFVSLVAFDTEYEKSQKLLGLINKGMEEIAAKGPSDEYFNKTKENLIKAFPEKLISNSYWNNIVKDYYINNYDANTNYIETVKTVLTKENIMKIAKSVISGNEVKVIMNPEVKK